MKYFKIVLLVATLPGLFFVSRTSDPSAFHKPERVMMRGEWRHAELLDRDEMRLSVVDLADWQAENYALKSRMETGDSPQTTGDSPQFLKASDLPASFTFVSGGREKLILPSKDGISISDELRSLFVRLQSETDLLLLISLSVLAAAIVLIFRRYAFFVAMPVVCSVLSTLGVLGYLGREVNFFQMLSLFIVIGLGMDYSIFHQSAGHISSTVRKTVLVSFLTSFAAFGALAFTTFPVTRSMGLTLSLGLLFAYLYSLPGKTGDSPHRQNWGQSPNKRGQSPKGSLENGDSPQINGDSPRFEKWFEQKEQSAGRFRIALMWWIYRFFGKNIAKLLFFLAWLFIYPFCGAARRALAEYYEAAGVRPRPFRHLLSFAWSLFDKADACSLCKNAPRFDLDGDLGWLDGGAFLVSTHLGTIEVLPALKKAFPGRTAPRVHAFQQMGHDAVFTSLFLEHADRSLFSLHAVEDIGVETAVEMQEAIKHGELVLMAGDRPSAGSPAVLEARFLDRECVWPKGVFAFARLMESPVYAIVAVKTGWNRYRIVSKRIDGNGILEDYVAFLEKLVREYPYQWYQFYGFFRR